VSIVRRDSCHESLDELDRRILTFIQKEFPIEERPYHALADRLGVTEEEVMARIRWMKEAGYIRRIGAIFDLRKLGYHSTLVAAKVPPDRMEEVARMISTYPGVTHNYERADSFNLWFTLIASSEEVLSRILEEMKERTGIREMFSLPAVRTFKIGVHFNLME